MVSLWIPCVKTFVDLDADSLALLSCDPSTCTALYVIMIYLSVTVSVNRFINQSINLYFRHWTHRTIKKHKSNTVTKTERDRENAAIQSHNINQSHQMKIY